MWNNKLSLATALFYTLRYLALVDTVVVMLGYLSWPGWQTIRVRLSTRLPSRIMTDVLNRGKLTTAQACDGY